MKYFITLLAILISFSSLAQKEHPEQALVQETAHSFLKLIVAEEYDEAKNISTKETGKMIDQIKMYASMIPDEMLAEVKEARNKARRARLTFTDFEFEDKLEYESCGVTFISSENPNKPETIYLKKSNGKWLVDMSFQMPTKDATDAVEEAADAAKEAVEEAAEAVEEDEH